MSLMNASGCTGDRITSTHSQLTYEVSDLGIMYPEQHPCPSLQAGQVGYVVLGMKTTRDAFIGDTFYREGTASLIPYPHTIPVLQNFHFQTGHRTEAFPGFQPAKSMVFAGLYPIDTGDYGKLQDALDRLTLNDASVSVHKETSLALGQGFRLGFLGSLHMDVFSQRLEEEYEAAVINTAPTVPYLVRYLDGTERVIRNPAQFPDVDEHAKVKAFAEPMVNGTLIFPEKFLGGMMDLCGVGWFVGVWR